MKNKPFLAIAFAILAACSSCGNDGPSVPSTPSEPDKPNVQIPINIGTTISRATETAFENGDQMGLFVVNRNADGSAVPLKPSGNYVDNMLYTYVTSWNPASALYWKDAETHADFYMYYPYTATMTSVEAMPWSVKTDQSAMSDYKASELLIGKTLDVAPSENAVNISAKHIMAQIVISLAAGKGFTAASLANANIKVKINNVKTQAIANIASGMVTATGSNGYVIPLKEGEEYKSLVVPQTLGNGNLITVTVDGTEFSLPKDPKLVALEQGHRYQITVTLSKTSSGMNADIVGWKDDGNDYGGTAEPE